MGVRIQTIWVSAGNFVSRILQFAATLILARLLLPEDFGLIATIQSVTGLLGLLASNGWGQALVREKELDEITCHTVFTFQLVVFLISVLVLLLFSDAIAGFFGSALMASLLPVASLALIMRPFQTVPSALLNRRTKFSSIAVVNTLAALIPPFFSIPLAYFGFGPWSLVAGQLVSVMVTSLGLAYYSRYRPRLMFSFPRFMATFSVSSQFVIFAVLEHLTNWAPIAIVTKRIGLNPAGILQRGVSTAQIPSDLTAQSLTPPLFRAMAASDEKEKAAYYLRAIGATTLYLWPVAVLLFIYSHETIDLLYGKNWHQAGPVLSIFSGFLLFFAIYSPSRTVLSSGVGLTFLVVVRMVGTAVMLSAVWIVAIRGLNAVVFWIVGLYALETLIILAQAMKILAIPFTIPLKVMFPPFLGSMAMLATKALLVDSSSNFFFIFEAALLGSVYLIVVAALHHHNPESKLLVSKMRALVGVEGGKD